MVMLIKKIHFREWIHVFMVLMVIGFFVVACGSNDPTGLTNAAGLTNACGSGGVSCHNSGLCCPSTSPYYCADKVDQSNGSKDGCFSSNCGNSCCKVQFEQCT